MAVDHIGRHAAIWSDIQGSTYIMRVRGRHSHFNGYWPQYMRYLVDTVLCRHRIRWMQDSIDTVPGVCCTQIALCSVLAVLGVSCAPWMLYSMSTIDPRMESLRGMTLLCVLQDGRVVDDIVWPVVWIPGWVSDKSRGENSGVLHH